MSQDPLFLAIGDSTFEQRYNRVIRDYLADPQQINAYGYARTNPILLKDTSGLGPEVYFKFIGDLATYDGVINLYNKNSDFRTALSSPNSSIVHKISTGADFAWEASLFVPPLAPIGVLLFLWEGFKRGGEIITGVDLEEELKMRENARSEDGGAPVFNSVNQSIFQPNWNLFGIGNSSPTSNTSPARGNGGGMISVPGTNSPRSRDPVDFYQGKPVYCWGACD
jgi:hypothetical protein